MLQEGLPQRIPETSVSWPISMPSKTTTTERILYYTGVN